MANEEHLATLKKGVKAWNAWREANPEMWPDLSEANLSGANLRWADLERADLTQANLAGAYLEEANLAEANLHASNLSGANLNKADLSSANLVKAVFNGAYLGGANLIEADLGEATMVKAVLSAAYLRAANLIRADLGGANLMKANLMKANLNMANLTGANLHAANLGAANLTEAYLDGANLSQAHLIEANLVKAKLNGANFREAYFIEANLAGASLNKAELSGANLDGANLTEADLIQASLKGAGLFKANLIEAKLQGADLSHASIVQTDLTAANLDGSRIYGASVWDVETDDETKQTNLIITPYGEPAVMVDDIEVAQFIYLMLNNKKIRNVIDAITGRGVLILGRFYEERKAILDAVRDRLRQMNLVPMVFDWDKPTSRDLTETVQLLANMSRFIVADVTDAKSIPQELSHIVPFLPSVPVRPIILSSEHEYSMFEHWTGYKTMLPVFRYEDQQHLIDNIHEALIKPVEEWEAGYDDKKALEDENARLRAEIERLKDGGSG